jgi:hypothetical protein
VEAPLRRRVNTDRLGSDGVAMKMLMLAVLAEFEIA